MSIAALSVAAALVAVGSLYYTREMARELRFALRREWLLYQAFAQLDLDAGSSDGVARLRTYYLECARQIEHDGDFRLPPLVTQPWPEDR